MKRLTYLTRILVQTLVLSKEKSTSLCECGEECSAELRVLMLHCIVHPEASYNVTHRT